MSDDYREGLPSVAELLAERYGSAAELEAERRAVRSAGLREPEPEPEPDEAGEGRAARLAASWWRLPPDE